jgi:hypothetical protein
LRRSPSSSLLLELEVEYAELESTSLAPTIARALPQLSFFLDRRLSLCLFLCLLLWSHLDRYLSVRNVVPTLTSNKRQGLSLNGRY